VTRAGRTSGDRRPRAAQARARRGSRSARKARAASCRRRPSRRQAIPRPRRTRRAARRDGPRRRGAVSARPHRTQPDAARTADGRRHRRSPARARPPGRVAPAARAPPLPRTRRRAGVTCRSRLVPRTGRAPLAPLWLRKAAARRAQAGLPAPGEGRSARRSRGWEIVQGSSPSNTHLARPRIGGYQSRLQAGKPVRSPKPARPRGTREVVEPHLVGVFR